MSFCTKITKTWLTRSFKPFTFQKKYSNLLAFDECQNLGLYIHIPFCRKICNFCPYCKTKYSKETYEQYIVALLEEIHLVSSQAGKPKEVTSLYFGGGTPALAKDHLGDIIKTIQDYFIITEGIGIELHPDDVTVPILKKLKAVGITKLSIGIQSFNEKYQAFLGRETVAVTEIAKALAKFSFETVSMDFIFALPGQNFADLKADIDIAFKNGANHIAIYPFIDFTFTNSTLPIMNKKQKQRLLNEITEYCLDKGYIRTSIWTFAAEKGACYSSMTRDNFLGFGCSATTLLKDQFKINTFSIGEYCKRIKSRELPTSLTLSFSLRQRMIYYLFWTAYTTKIDIRDFQDFFGVPLKKFYRTEFWLLKMLGYLKENDAIYTMTLKGAFYYHYFESFYTLAYIDKMWGIMQKEAFPLKIEL